jgi:hypothetical protein
LSGNSAPKTVPKTIAAISGPGTRRGYAGRQAAAPPPVIRLADRHIY